MRLNKHLPRAWVCVNTGPPAEGVSRGVSDSLSHRWWHFEPRDSCCGDACVCVCEDTNPPGMGCRVPSEEHKGCVNTAGVSLTHGFLRLSQISICINNSRGETSTQAAAIPQWIRDCADWLLWIQRGNDIRITIDMDSGSVMPDFSSV